MSEARETYMQVGFTAMRDPATKEFLPAVPLYIRNEDSAAAGQETLIRDLGQLFAQRMKAYRDGCRKAGVTV